MYTALYLVAALATPPPGAVRYCATYPTECADSAPAVAPPSVLPILRRVNDDVNSSIEEPWDPSPEFTALVRTPWTIHPARGVCKDYAVTKRHDLVTAGLPSGAMSLAYLQPSRSSYNIRHLVLLVRVGDNTYVLDNLTSTIWTYDQTTEVYDYVSRQDYGHPQRWIPTP